MAWIIFIILIIEDNWDEIKYGYFKWAGFIENKFVDFSLVRPLSLILPK